MSTENLQLLFQVPKLTGKGDLLTISLFCPENPRTDSPLTFLYKLNFEPKQKSEQETEVILNIEVDLKTFSFECKPEHSRIDFGNPLTRCLVKCGLENITKPIIQCIFQNKENNDENAQGTSNRPPDNPDKFREYLKSRLKCLKSKGVDVAVETVSCIVNCLYETNMLVPGYKEFE